MVRWRPCTRPVYTGVRFPLPEFTARVDGCQKMHPSSRAVNSAREHGPWTRVVETDLKMLLVCIDCFKYWLIVVWSSNCIHVIVCYELLYSFTVSVEAVTIECCVRSAVWLNGNAAIVDFYQDSYTSKLSADRKYLQLRTFLICKLQSVFNY